MLNETGFAVCVMIRSYMSRYFLLLLLDRWHRCSSKRHLDFSEKISATLYVLRERHWSHVEWTNLLKVRNGQWAFVISIVTHCVRSIIYSIGVVALVIFHWWIILYHISTSMFFSLRQVDLQFLSRKNLYLTLSVFIAMILEAVMTCVPLPL
jgi:hypothetical protein